MWIDFWNKQTGRFDISTRWIVPAGVEQALPLTSIDIPIQFSFVFAAGTGWPQLQATHYYVSITYGWWWQASNGVWTWVTSQHWLQSRNPPLSGIRCSGRTLWFVVRHRTRLRHLREDHHHQHRFDESERACSTGSCSTCIAGYTCHDIGARSVGEPGHRRRAPPSPSFDATVDDPCLDTATRLARAPQSNVNVIVGTEGPDELFGSNKRDAIFGLGGDDVVRGFNGADLICGGEGNDGLVGGQGSDLILGGNGDEPTR